MLLGLFLLLLLFTLLFSSFHCVVLLLLVEFFVLYNFFALGLFSSAWTWSLMFLFIGVCLGAYGVSLLLSAGRSKGSFFTVGFKF